MKKRTRFSTFFIILICISISLACLFHFKNKSRINADIENLPQSESKTIEQKTKKPNATANILMAGDVMFHMPQIRGAYDAEKGIYDFKDCFKYVKEYVEPADLALVNLETALAGNEKGIKGYPNFNSPVESLDALKYAGFDIISTANNHILDQGKDGLINTIDSIESYGFKNIGTHKEPNESLLIKKVNDINVGILSYTYGCNGMEYTLTDEELSYMVNIIDEKKIESDIKKVKNKGSDVVVVIIHWGNEYEREPSSEQMELGEKMIQWGADIVFGSHPHVVQKSEIVKSNGENKFIIYSLGNFLSNQRRENLKNKYTEDGIMVNVEVEKDFSKNKTIIKNVTYIPTWVSKYMKNGKPKYEILPVEDFLENQNMSEETLSKVKESYENTMNQMK